MTIYSGSVPAIHGITGNNWRDQATGKDVYCVDDATVMTIGSQSEEEVLEVLVRSAPWARQLAIKV